MPEAKIAKQEIIGSVERIIEKVPPIHEHIGLNQFSGISQEESAKTSQWPALIPKPVALRFDKTRAHANILKELLSSKINRIHTSITRIVCRNYIHHWH